MIKTLRTILMAFVALAICVLPVVSARAQVSEPTQIIETAFADLSLRVGKTVNRSTLETTDSFAWEQTFFKGAITCPGTPESTGTTQISGFIIRISYSGVAYEYRAKTDGSEIYYCNAAQNQQIIVVAPGGVPGSVIGQGATPQPGAATGTGVTVWPGAASATFKNALAFVGPTGDVVVTMGGVEAQIVYLTNDAGGTKLSKMPFYQTNRIYGDLRWSPDGTKLAFTEQTSRSLYVAVSGQKARLVAQGIEAQFPPAWSPDGSSVAYLVSTGQVQNDKGVLQAQAVDTATFQPRAVGTVLQGGGCGGGGEFSPSTLLQLRENGRPFAPKQELVWADQGFIHNMGCAAYGLTYTTFAGQAIWEQPNFNAAVVSPDRKLAIGYTSGRMAPFQPAQPQGFGVLNISNGSVTPIALQPSVDLFAWSADSTSIYYTTITTLRTVTLNPSGATVQQVVGSTGGWETGSYSVGLWRVPAAGGQSEQLYTAEGLAIGTIAQYNPDQVLVFSLIKSDAAMVDQINANAPAANVLPLVPTTEIRGLTLIPPINAQSAFSWYTDSRSPAPGRGNVDFTAVAMGPVTASASSAAPSTGSTAPNAQGSGNLVIGGRAVVLVDAGSSLNLRANPSASAQVRRTLKNQETVTIVSGPQLAEGFRWWQVRADSDGNTGWVVDSVQGATGPENTLSPIQ